MIQLTKPFILIVLLGCLLPACTPPADPVSVTQPVTLVGTAVPTTTPAFNEVEVEVTRVVGTAEPTATPAPCTPLPEGMQLTISMAEQDRTVLLVVTGLLPEDQLIILLKGESPNHSSAIELTLANPVGPDGRYQDTFHLGESDIVNWTGQIIHQRGAACFEFTFPLSEPIVLAGMAVPPQETTWTTYQSEALQLVLQHPSTWTAEERDGFLYLWSPEQYSLGDGPQQLVYYVYSGVFPNPEQKPFEEVVTADLSAELRQIFSYTAETIGEYTVYRTTDMPSASGALTVFFAAEDRFVSLALTPYRPDDPFEAQDQHVAAFEQILTSVQLLNGD